MKVGVYTLSGFPQDGVFSITTVETFDGKPHGLFLLLAILSNKHLLFPYTHML